MRAACAGRYSAAVTAAPNISPTDEYRRRARRLRHVWAGNPVRLQRSLANLARSCDGRRTPAACGLAPTSAVRRAKPQAAEQVITPVPPRDVRAADSFAGMVADRMTGPVLPYSGRQSLLRAATRMGIGRFEANLIIAAVQYRTCGREQARESAPTPQARPSPRALFLTAAVVQAIIVAAVRWIAC